MNDNKELNEKIATICGWKSPDHPDCKEATKGWATGHKWWIDPEGKLRICHDVPKYCEDLNAMHEAEKCLTDTQQGTMIDYLVIVEKQEGWNAFHATAAQRAEAFLKTVGQWDHLQTATQ